MIQIQLNGYNLTVTKYRWKINKSKLLTYKKNLKCECEQIQYNLKISIHYS